MQIVRGSYAGILGATKRFYHDGAKPLKPRFIVPVTSRFFATSRFGLLRPRSFHQPMQESALTISAAPFSIEPAFLSRGKETLCLAIGIIQSCCWRLRRYRCF